MKRPVMARKAKPAESVQQHAPWPALGSPLSVGEARAALDRVVEAAINSGKSNTGDLIRVASLRAHLGSRNPKEVLSGL